MVGDVSAEGVCGVGLVDVSRRESSKLTILTGMAAECLRRLIVKHSAAVELPHSENRA